MVRILRVTLSLSACVARGGTWRVRGPWYSGSRHPSPHSSTLTQLQPPHCPDMGAEDMLSFSNPMQKEEEEEEEEEAPSRRVIRVGLALESTVTDAGAARGVESALDVADLSQMLRGAAASYFGGGITAERRMEKIFTADDDERVLDTQGLRSIIENSLGFVLEDVHLQHLMLEIDSDADGTITLGEFRAWFQDLYGKRSGKEVHIDPHTMALRKMAAAGMLDPSGHFRQGWDLTQALLLFYVAFLVPYRVGFDVAVCAGATACLRSATFLFDMLVDFYFIVDIGVNFRTAVLSSQGIVIIEPREVAKRYVRGWFVIDVLASFPFSYIVHFIDGGEDANSHKLLKVLRLLRLMKLLRLVRIKRIMDRWEDEMYSTDGLVMLFKLAFLVALCSHWLCCTWFFVGTLPAELGPGETSEILPGWVEANWPQHESMDQSELYFESFVWSGLAVLMVQGSELSPETAAWEKAIYVVAFLVGAVVMSLIIGNMSDIIAHANPGQSAQKDLNGQVHAFLHDRKVDKGLTRRVRNHFNHHYRTAATTMDLYAEVFAMLPYDIKTELAVALRFVDNPAVEGEFGFGCFHKVPWCKDLQPEDLIRIGCAMTHQFALPPVFDENGHPVADGVMHGRAAGLIMEQGERGDEMFVVEKGIVQITITDDAVSGKQRILGKLRMNDVFGELGALVEETPGTPLRRMRTAYAITHDCSLLSLSFNRLLQLRSQSWGIDTAVARAAERIRRDRKLLFIGHKSAVRNHVNFEHFAYTTMKLRTDIEHVRTDMRSEMDAMHTKLDEIKVMLSSSSN
eukprot:COSAG02_NODE_1129_length_14415_cov_828.291911_7_plen_797_part_00